MRSGVQRQRPAGEPQWPQGQGFIAATSWKRAGNCDWRAAREIDRLCATDKEGDQLLRHALARLLLSARAYHRVLRVARTIADLVGEASIGAAHIAEAIQYRRLDASF